MYYIAVYLAFSCHTVLYWNVSAGCYMLLPKRAMCVFTSMHQICKTAGANWKYFKYFFNEQSTPKRPYRCPTVFMRLSLYPLAWTICNNRGTNYCNLLHLLNVAYCTRILKKGCRRRAGHATMFLHRDNNNATELP